MLVINFSAFYKGRRDFGEYTVDNDTALVVGMMSYHDTVLRHHQNVEVRQLRADKVHLESIRQHFSNIRMCDASCVTWVDGDAQFITTNLVSLALPSNHRKD